MVSPSVQTLCQLLNCLFTLIVYLSSVLSYASVEGDEMERSQRVRLVSRPMQQNIFWDEFEGQILDVRELLQPSPQMTHPKMGDMMSNKPLMENGILPKVKDQKFEGRVKERHHKDSQHSLKSRTNLDPELSGSMQRF